MRYLSLSAAFIVLLNCTLSRAADSPLEPLGWLVGGTWVAELKPPKGDPLEARMTVEWTAHKQALKYAIVFKSKDAEFTQYEGTFYWHPGKKEIRSLQINRAGEVTEGATIVADGKLLAKNMLTRTDGTTQEQRTELARDGDDAFKFRALIPKGDEWVEGLNISYKRVKDVPAKR
jgi:hypothetical protein